MTVPTTSGGSSSSRELASAATGEQSFAAGDDVRLFEHAVLRDLLLQELYEVHAFFHQRIMEKKEDAEREADACSSSSIDALQQLSALPKRVDPSLEQLQEWLEVSERVVELLAGKRTLELLLLQSNGKALSRVMTSFAAARRKRRRYARDLRHLHHRLAKIQREVEEEQQQLAATKREVQELCAAVEAQCSSQFGNVRFSLIGIPLEKKLS